MTGKFFSVLLILLVQQSGFYGQLSNNKLESKKTNLEILEQNISGELEKIFYYPDINRDMQFVFLVKAENKDNTQKKFIESVIKKTAERNKIKVSFPKDDNMNPDKINPDNLISNDSSYYKALVTIIKLGVSYPRFGKNRFLGEKTLVRKIISDLDIEITQNNGTKIIEDNINTEYEGEIEYDDYEQLQNSEYSFTRGVPPDISLIETIIFPAAIVLLSAAATVLFFTIRSK